MKSGDESSYNPRRSLEFHEARIYPTSTRLRPHVRSHHAARNIPQVHAALQHSSLQSHVLQSMLLAGGHCELTGEKMEAMATMVISIVIGFMS